MLGWTTPAAAEEEAADLHNLEIGIERSIKELVANNRWSGRLELIDEVAVASARTDVEIAPPDFDSRHPDSGPLDPDDTTPDHTEPDKYTDPDRDLDPDPDLSPTPDLGPTPDLNPATDKDLDPIGDPDLTPDSDFDFDPNLEPDPTPDNHFDPVLDTALNPDPYSDEIESFLPDHLGFAEPHDLGPEIDVDLLDFEVPIVIPSRPGTSVPDINTISPADNDDLYTAGETFLQRQPAADLPFSDLKEIYEAYGSLAGLGTRQDLTDDLRTDDAEPEQVPTLTAGRTVLVIDALAELGAFQREDNPATITAIRSIRNVIPSDGLTADGYRAEIRRFKNELQPALELLEADGVEVSPALKQMSNALTADVLDALDNGETSIVDPQPWLNGLSDLVVRGGAAPPVPAARTADRPAVMAVVAAVGGIEIERLAPGGAGSDQTGTGGDDFGLAPSSGWPWPAAAFIAAVLALLAALVFVRRRTTSAPGAGQDDNAPPKLSITDLLDASRRMTASLDVGEIGTIVLAETRRLVAAEGCIIARRDGKGLSALHHEPAELFEPSVLSDPEATESCLRRVVETGQATVMIASDEPVLVEVPMALVAVPIVVDGRVAGAMLIVRVSTRPFDRDDVEALELLAPMVGTALQSAATHGSATALAETEPLTGLKNRRRLEQDLASLDENPTVSYIMIDVDHFKNFNDRNGHAAGDEALRRVARVLEATVRPGDLVYRYGGEEFCMLLPNVSHAGALAVAERIRQAVESADIPGGEAQPAGRVTVSVGVACDGPAEALVERADAALYEAKRGGRNQVRLAQHA